MRSAAIATLLMVAISACQGPKEIAGGEKDRAVSANSGVAISGKGPNQRLGAAQDKRDRAESDAREAEATALETQAGSLRTKADVEADRLEAQAKSVRARKAE